MERVKFLLLSILLSLVLSSAASGQYYYGNGQQIPITIDSTYITVRFDDTITTLFQQQLPSAMPGFLSITYEFDAIDDFVVYELDSVAVYEQVCDSLESTPGIGFVEPLYRNQTEVPFLAGTGFCVAFEEYVTEQQVDSINALFSVSIDHELYGMPNVYLLRNSPSSELDLLDLANQYYVLPETRYSHPNFGGALTKMWAYEVHDYYSTEQWHLKRVIGRINEASVWDFHGVLDNTIVVAVVDDGVTSHEDLPSSRLLSGCDFYYYDSDPTPGEEEAHGMACAGIIGASHTTDSVAGLLTSSGVISMCPTVKVLPVKRFSDEGVGTGPNVPAEAISWAYLHGADVISNSWGFDFAGEGSARPFDEYDALNEAIANASLFGRGGRGCVVVFSSGNPTNNPEGVAYPSNRPEVIAVGALTSSDSRWYYSRYGSELDLTAPSGDICLTGDVWTLDQMSTLGFNPNVTHTCDYYYPTWNCSSPNDTDYDCNFGGTSAASPLVSGAAALLLSRDSTLSGPAVKYILEQSAETDLHWGTLPDSHHVEYGYGRVDAFRAVLSISRGDTDNDGFISDSSDLGKLVNYLFGSVDMFPSNLLGDVNCSGTVDSSDLGYLSNYLFAVPPGSEPAPENPCFKFGT